jgi:WD40 repeat protein
LDILINISIYYILFWDANKFTKITMGCSQSSVQPQQDEEEKEKTIKKLETIIENVVLDTEVYIQAIIETEDKRIATGGSDGNISISSYDINKKKFQRDIYEELAHDGEVSCLCSLKGNRLLSGGEGFVIKLWALSSKTITLTKEINGHFGTINHLILLSHERFASCSDDGTARIWKNDETYECISLFNHENEVTTVLQPKGKEELVTTSFYFNGLKPGAKTGTYPFGALSVTLKNTLLEDMV